MNCVKFVSFLENENEFLRNVKSYNELTISLRFQLYHAAANNQQSAVWDCFQFKQGMLTKWGLPVKQSEAAARNANYADRGGQGGADGPDRDSVKDEETRRLKESDFRLKQKILQYDEMEHREAQDAGRKLFEALGESEEDKARRRRREEAHKAKRVDRKREL